MSRLTKTSAILALALIPITTSAVVYNDDITAIFGSGNPDDGWTSETSGSLELALRAKNRVTGDTSNVNGVYSYPDAPPTRGRFNYEFSINSDVTGGGSTLSRYDYFLGVDQDSSAGVNLVFVDPLFYWGDNSFGLSSTANGAGSEPANLVDYLSFPFLFTIAQNSQNVTFGGYPGGALPLEPNATYDYQLFAVAKGAGINGARLADVGIQVVIGAGGAAVPDSGTTGLMFAGAFGVLALATRAVRRN
jgi:hypothetical protein